MDSLHATLSSLRTETKSARDHLTVFREFLTRLDQLQRQAPPMKALRAKSPLRRKSARRGRG
jgi:hypothetical protein